LKTSFFQERANLCVRLFVEISRDGVNSVTKKTETLFKTYAENIIGCAMRSIALLVMAFKKLLITGVGNLHNFLIIFSLLLHKS